MDKNTTLLKISEETYAYGKFSSYNLKWICTLHICIAHDLLYWPSYAVDATNASS